MADHVIEVVPAQKMDTPVGLYRFTCSCGRRGGVESRRGALRSGVQHARDLGFNPPMPPAEEVS